MSSVPVPSIAVIGGGFSGAITAANLTRLGDTPAHVTLIDPGRAVGRGTAYALRRPEYLLNVAARNMSAFPDQPDHLLRWLRTRPEFEAVPDADLRTRFIPRQTYGDYLTAIVGHHLRASSGISSIATEFVTGEAVDITPAGPGCTIHLANGATVPADRVVLATGNEPPAALPGTDVVADHPAWVGDPWQAWEHRIPADADRIVLLGTGLTTVDAVLTLRAVGWAGDIHAVSRHGWLPHSHFRGADYPDFPPRDLDLTALALDELVELVETHCTILTERGLDPAIVVDKLRPHTQAIWTGFSLDERRTFATRHAARWNVHRHRIAPEIHAQLADSQESGRLHVHAASITGLDATGRRVAVHLDDGRQLTGDLVINATGPSTRFTRTGSVLLQNLLRRGLIAPDPLDMGVAVDADHVVRTSTGERSPWLVALGPLLKGTYWETIAVPEIRVQARRVAETLLDRVGAKDDVPPLLEYLS